MNFRRVLLWLHRWAGVLSGLFILCLAITGGALVFETTITRWLKPALYPAHSTPQAQRAPFEKAVRTLSETHPDARVQGIRLPRDEADALVLFTGNQAAHFDPGTGTLLGMRPRMGGWEQTMIKLHVNLLQGPTGGTVVVVATSLVIGLALTGLWLWWPLRIVWMGKRVSFRRLNLDLHSVAGLYSSLFLLIIAVSGLTLRYLHGEHPRPPMAPFHAVDEPRITVDQAIAAAEKALPEALAVSLEMPAANPRAPFRVQLAFSEDGSPAGRSVVFLDPCTADVLAVHSSRVGTLLQKYQMAQLSIHTGAVGGTLTRWLAFLTCLAVVLQVLSGYVLWWKRDRPRSS